MDDLGVPLFLETPISTTDTTIVGFVEPREPVLTMAFASQNVAQLYLRTSPPFINSDNKDNKRMTNLRDDLGISN